MLVVTQEVPRRKRPAKIFKKEKAKKNRYLFLLPEAYAVFISRIKILSAIAWSEAASRNKTLVYGAVESASQVETSNGLRVSLCKRPSAFAACGSSQDASH